MTLFDETPALRQLLTSYFHEDWTMDRRNFVEVVRNFVQSEPPEVVARASAEARALLASPVPDQSIEEGLGDVGCYFYLPAAGRTPRDWLSEVVSVLDAAH